MCSELSDRQVDPPPEPSDVAGMIIAAFLLAWILFVLFMAQGIAWVVEQSLQIEGDNWPFWAGPLIAVVQSFLLTIPLLPLASLWRRARVRALFQAWAVAALYNFFLAPGQLFSGQAWLIGVLLQIGGTLLYLILIFAIVRRQKGRHGGGLKRPSGPYWPSLLLVPLVSLGWLLWGAFGSWLDTLLTVLSALLFGLAAAIVIAHFLQPAFSKVEGNGWNFSLGGFAVGAILLMMSAGQGIDGQQLLLMASLPAMAWIVMALQRIGRGQTANGATCWLTLGLFIGLAASAPLALSDPPEFSLLLNVGSRDILVWLSYATALSIGGAWVLGFTLFLLRRRLPEWRNRVVTIAGPLLSWSGAILLYFLAGQPGLHGEQLFVIMANQASVADIGAAPNSGDRRNAVYERLRDHAESSQASIRADLDRLGLDYTAYYLVNAVEVDAGPGIRAWLSNRADVDRILSSTTLRPLPAPSPVARGDQIAPADLPWNLTQIGADRVWRELGIRGHGIVVGHSDSGVDWQHHELESSYRGRDGRHDYNWFDPWSDSGEPGDLSGHGTHTLGSIVGQRVGVAPEATWYACSNLERNLGNPAFYLDCMQFMLAPFPIGGDPFQDGRPELGAHVINNSWGCPPIEGCDATALLQGVRALRAAGIFVVAAAGNDGSSCSTIREPLALYDEVFSVGAVDSSGILATFSSRGPVTIDGSDRLKPDLVAPGVAILSSFPGDTYALSDGTSMAGPHVTGVVALMWSANTALIGDVEGTESILIETAAPNDGLPGPAACAGDNSLPNNAVGYGIVDAYAAVRRALELAP